MGIGTLHLLLGRSIVFFTFICGVWGILAFFGRLPNDSRYYSTLVLAELLLLAQTALGVVLMATGRVPRDMLHLAYGGLAAVLLPIVHHYSVRNGWNTGLTCGLVSLFIGGLSIRAFTTVGTGISALLGSAFR